MGAMPQRNLSLAALALALFGLSHARGDDSGYVRIDLARRWGNHLVAPVRVNGKTARMMVDSGAGVSCIDPARDLEFGFRAIKGVSAKLNGEKHGITRLESLGIGPVEIRNLKVALVRMDATNHARTGESRVDGILGLDVLRAGRAVIDCQQLRLFWKAIPTRPNLMAVTLPKAGWTAVKLEVVGNHYVAPGAVNGKPARFLIDTGAFATLVDRGFAATAGLAENGMRLHSVGLHSEDTNSHTAQPNLLSVGGFVLKDLPVAVTGLGIVRTIDRRANVILGGDALGRNLGVIDCEQNVLYLKSPR